MIHHLRRSTSAAEVSGMRQVVGDRLYHTLGEATGVSELKFINP